MNRATPTTGGTSAMKNVAPMHSAVKPSRNGIRRPPRSENAPRTGDTAALMPTLITIASDSTTLPSRSPNCVSLIRYSPIAPDTTANENIVFAKSYRVQAPCATGRRFGSRAPVAIVDGAGTVGAVIVTPGRARDRWTPGS